jgi:probable HAF family extracellular repeat protein
MKCETPGCITAIALSAVLAISVQLPAQEHSDDHRFGQKPKHQMYSVVVLPPDGGPDSFLAGYLFYAPLTNGGTLGVFGDTSAPGVNNSYTQTNGQQVDLQALPQLPDLTGTSTYINWINQWGLAAGFGTRTNTVTGASLDNAAIWFPNGQIFPLKTPEGGQSHAVWINSFGQASGWIAPNSIADPCAFGVGLQSQGVVWDGGFVRPLGTLGGTDSYGEFINDLGQISGHSQTSNVVSSNTGCPPFDPFIWQNGKMTDIHPGNFGGAEGGTNFLNNQGQAVGFGTLQGDADAHPFLWSRGKLTDLYNVGNLGGPVSSAFNVNELGHVVGVSTNAGGAVLAVLWRNGEFANLMTLGADGDDCSEPYRINSLDQIVGVSFSCETGVSHAFLWEGGVMADLNTLIPANSGLELQSANWINDDGVIAAQGVLTEGSNSGDTRAVLLIPAGQWIDDAQGPKNTSSSSDVIRDTPKTSVLIQTHDGRVNPVLLRPFDPAALVGKKQN